ncbi:peptidoglycan DD-metalloendopeptidase family protein [Neisseria sicca]|uniref:peptidoglycan DD-metalloendopeptidase family protein n=1 Tax=Neisseria sicca TaxID=490 RepID=UPI001957B08E|nr:peptidoglycan DD-metalloendopeptidase family protein [Neisseria sicca]VTX69553.1 Murein hydrolase activator EnvC [Neisseria sicca]
MRYKPLLLALLIGFASPSFAAKDAPKEKAAPVKKSVKDKKDAEPAKKEAAKDKAKPTAKKETAEAVKNERAKERKNDKEVKKQDKGDKTKKGEAKAEEKAGKAVPAKTEPVKGKDKAADKPAAKNNVKAKKEAAELPKKDEAAVKQDRKAVEKKADKADKKTAAADSDDFKAAVTAAANDLESKKSLRSRNEGFIIHVNTTLKQLQQSRINLSAINRQQRDAWDKFQKLNADLNYLKTQVSNTRAQISRFVSGNYKNSQPNAVALFLKNAEPGQKTRFLRYTRYINTANDQVIKDLEKQQKDLAAQEQKINNELAYLKKLQVNIQSSLRRQGVTNTAEQAESRRQNAQMAKDAQKKINHKENEQRLNNLLKDLDKRKAEQRRQEAEARKKAAEARLAAVEKARKDRAAAQKAADERAAMSNLTAEDMNIRAPSYVRISNANSFSRMQGRLKKPVSGTLAGLFGQDRGDGEVWKGVFYQTTPAIVSSIAGGTVTYADELEGFGKVIVIDHGDGYISIYSGLSEIEVAKGYAVAAGNRLGISGTLPSGMEGLYLEVRYNGQAMNPLSWIS